MSYILIVDDDMDARMILRGVVHSMGHKAIEATNGNEALDHIKGDSPDLVFLDLMMPGLDGFGVLKWMQSSPKTRRVPVVVISALSESELGMMALPGVTEVLRKGNFTVRQIRDMVQQIL